jgi:hypothetical protein
MHAINKRLQRKAGYQSYYENEAQYKSALFGLFYLTLSGTLGRTGLFFGSDTVIGGPLLADATILSRGSGSIRGTRNVVESRWTEVATPPTLKG